MSSLKLNIYIKDYKLYEKRLKFNFLINKNLFLIFILMKRLCTIAAHKEAEIKFLCINPQCTQPSRWICAVCLLKETHNKDPNYKKSFLKDQDEFYELLICKERSNYY